MKILYLTGWQQEPDALAVLAPDAIHFDYGKYGNVEAMFAALPSAPDLAIGWSLGGQLLARAVAAGYVRPKKMLLLAAPFQCIVDAYFPERMPQAEFHAILGSYRKNPEEMLRQFQAIAGIGNMPEIWDNGLFWLEELGRASCRGLDFSVFPETCIVHCTEDKIIPSVHAEIFAGVIPNATLFLLSGGSHAPHLEHMDAVRKLITSCLTATA